MSLRSRFAIFIHVLVIDCLCGVALAQNEALEALEEFPKTRTASQCFHVPGIPTVQLRCPGGQLIRIRQPFYGAPPSNRSCQYRALDDHCIQLTDMTDNCMGRYVCSVYVSNPFLVTCRTYANYMQVNYTCIPKPRIFDMCQEHTMTSQHGFLSTPNYPDADYNPNQHCRCRLQTQDSGILLQLLDFSINHTEPGVCDTDYLRISDWGTKCGYINPHRLPESLSFSRQEVFLEFRSDSKHQARGFWIEFNGAEGGKVKLTCTSTILSEHNHGEDTVGNPPARGIPGSVDPSLEIEDSMPISKNDLVIIEDEHMDNYRLEEDDNHIQRSDDSMETIHRVKQSSLDKTAGQNEISSKTGHDVIPDGSDETSYDIDEVEIITGIVVGVLILIAVIIIIVLVFRR